MKLKSFIKQVKAAESTVSMVLGVIVVVVVGVILFNYFRNYSTISQESKEELSTKEGEINGGQTTSLPTKYVVAQGDSLWKISEKFFGSGYNWVDIRQENKISNPNQITEGQVLTIPSVPAKKPTVKVAESVKTPSNAIAGSEYTVTKGDSLWDISVRAYQDGYQWLEIAQANNLTQPNLIHPGNVLKIPR